MQIKQSKYKNVFAIRLETAKYIALVLPSEGGKIASFQDKATGKEYLLQNPSENYLHIGLTDDFEKGECSGFDDMFPTIDPVCVDGKEYPDHGEICRVPFSYAATEDKLVLKHVSVSLGYTYQKSFTEEKNGALRIAYEITNQTETPLRALWAGHCLLNAKQGGKIIVPFQEGAPIDCVYDSNQNLQKPVRLPYEEERMRTVWSEKIEAQKWYFFEKCPQGIVGYQYPEGDTFVMEFDKDKLPYLGLWLDYGLVNGSHYIGLEPCSLGYDTVVNAEKYGAKETLMEEKFTFEIYISIETA